MGRNGAEHACGGACRHAIRRKGNGMNRKRRKKNRNDGGDGGGGGGDVESCGNRCGAGQACVDGFCVTAFGEAGAGEGQRNRPTGIPLAVSGEELLVVDSGNGRIVQIFTADDAFLKAIGRQGSAVGAFNAPTGIQALNLNSFTVVDTGNNRVQQFLIAGASDEFRLAQRSPGAAPGRDP
jgi:hypothetical protein